MKLFRKMLCLAMAVAILSTAAISANACTTIAVGKDASADGSTMVAHSVDGWYDERIEIVQGGTHAEGEMVDIYGDGTMHSVMLFVSSQQKQLIRAVTEAEGN